jgi:hypothetical protein
MNKIYLVIIDLYDNEENSIVDICNTREKAEELMEEYMNNCKQHYTSYSYHIDEVELDSSKDILWDCYQNRDINNE